jgi:hypothetical protein
MLEDVMSSHQPELRRGDAARPVFVWSSFDLLSPWFQLHFELELFFGCIFDFAFGLLLSGTPSGGRGGGRILLPSLARVSGVSFPIILEWLGINWTSTVFSCELVLTSAFLKATDLGVKLMDEATNWMAAMLSDRHDLVTLILILYLIDLMNLIIA